MLDYGFSLLEKRELLKARELSFSIPVVGGDFSSVAVTNAEALSAILPKGHKGLTYKVELPAFVYAPVEKGDSLGKVVFFDDGKEVASCSLVAEEAVSRLVYEKTLSERILSFFGLR